MTSARKVIQTVLTSKEALLAAVILLAALAFRLPGLDGVGGSSGHEQDAVLFACAQPESFAKAGGDILVESNGYLYYRWVVGTWVKVYGPNLVTARGPSILAGVLAVMLVMVIGRQLGGGRTAALGGLLMAINSLAIYVCGNARFYSVNICLCCLASCCLLAFLRCRSQWRSVWLTVYLLAAAACVLTTVTSASLLAGHVLYVFCVEPSKRTAALVSGLVVLVTLGCLGWAWGRDCKALERIPSKPPLTVGSVVQIVGEFGGAKTTAGLAFSELDAAHRISYAGAATVAFGFPLLALASALWQAKAQNGKTMLPVLWFLVPMALVLGLSTVMPGIQGLSTLTFVVPGLTLLVASWLSRLSRLAIVGALVLYLAAAPVLLSHPYTL